MAEFSSLSNTAATSRRILRSARALLAEKGEAGFSMRAVAEGAGVTVGAIYRHFEDRSALIERVVIQAFESFELELTRAVLSQPVGSFARLVALGHKYMEFAQRHSEEFKILYSPDGERRKLGSLPGRGGYDLLRQCIVEAMEAGQMRRGDPDLTAFFLWSRVHGIVMLLLACDLSDEALSADGELTPGRAFEITRELALHGVAVEHE